MSWNPKGEAFRKNQGGGVGEELCAKRTAIILKQGPKNLRFLG